MTEVLKSWRLDSVGLDRALELAGELLGDGATALLTSSAAYEVMHLRNQQWILPPRSPGLNRSAVFELRAFSEKGEIRWLHEGGGVGPVVGLGDGPGAELPTGALDTSRQFEEHLPASSLLWGVVDWFEDGWAGMKEGRVGIFAVPLTNGHVGDEVVLQSREYVGVDTHGNAHVIDELLVSFEVEGDQNAKG